MIKIPPSIDYDAYYFANCTPPGLRYERSDHWIGLFDGIAEHIANEIKPITVLDAGCAMGFLVESLRNRNIEAFGIDTSEFAIQNVLPEIKPFCWVGSITEQFPQEKYDLIVCIEVLEHLPTSQAEKTIANFCNHSDLVLFSSTPVDYKEASHLNVNPVEYWTKLFARNNFFHDLDYDSTYITPWTMLYRRKAVSIEQIVMQYERKFYLYSIENHSLRDLALENRQELSTNFNTINRLNSKIAENERIIQSLQKQLELILTSRSWKILEKFRNTKLYPLFVKYFPKK